MAGSYDFEVHHLELLRLTCEALDRCWQARERVDEEGAYFVDRWGQPKAHPAVNVERDARLSAARLIRELGLDEEPSPDSRPPRRGGW